MTMKTAQWNAPRVLAAIGRIGYSPDAAILDIADNSISNGSTKVALWVHAAQEQREGPGRRRAIVSRITVIDDGAGMDEAALDNAIALGSSTDQYSIGTLSKFGMGLKSAASSLGTVLTITSRAADGTVRTAVLDQDVVTERGEYVYELRSPTQAEVDELDSVAEGNSGTCVAVTGIYEQLSTGPAAISESLKTRVGITYFFYMAGLVSDRPPLEVLIDGETVAGQDPIFADEADSNGDLDETTWTGSECRWVQRPQRFQLSELDASLTALVSIVQVPHPPSVSMESDIPQAQTRKRYTIGAGNYGFFIYRNGRLISWADSLGFVPQNQDMYAFKGRLEIDSDADEVLNIDVTKSRVYLSDIARLQLTPIAQEAVKKSRLAWENRSRAVLQKASSTPHDDINDQLNRVSELEEKSDVLDEEVAPEPEQKRLRERRKAAQDAQPASIDESERLRDEAQRVQYVATLDNNQLWERAHDASLGLIVRVNRSHRFVRDIVEVANENAALQKALDLLFFALARGEYTSLYKSEQKREVIESVLSEFRERVAGELSDIIRQLDVPSLFS